MTIKCDICGSEGDCAPLAVAPREEEIALCATCRKGAEGEISDAPHWKCLNDAIWSETPAVKVMAWRLLDALGGEPWARDLLDIAYLEEDEREWAEAARIPSGETDEATGHRDTHGAPLAAGDTVILIKDLNVKGAGFTAKRGTAVRNISLVPDEPGQIEGRVNGQQIVILTEFVKKSG